MTARVEAVCASPTHSVSKPAHAAIELVAGSGVAGDVHQGPTRRQVHLVPAELLDDLRGEGFDLAPGEVGENVTTRGVDLASLPLGARLGLGPDAAVELTGVRTPCRQMNGVRDGLARAMWARDQGGAAVPRAGVMAVVVAGGTVRAGDAVVVELPDPPHLPLPRV